MPKISDNSRIRHNQDKSPAYKGTSIKRFLFFFWKQIRVRWICVFLWICRAAIFRQLREISESQILSAALSLTLSSLGETATIGKGKQRRVLKIENANLTF